MTIRLIYLDSVQPIRSQAIYHGLANQISAADDPILVLVRPNQPYISVGLHQDIEQELNTTWCQQQNLPIIRRAVGGGTVLLDSHQLFFQYIFPRNKAPRKPLELYDMLLSPIVRLYEQLGIQKVHRKDNDIQVNHRKICGTGAGSIENASVVVGSFLFDFNYTLMAQCINAPSKGFSDSYLQLMQSRMTTLRNEMGIIPDDETLLKTLAPILKSELNLTPVRDDLSATELDAIKDSEDELVSEDWQHQSGRRLIKRGIKVSAQTYLVEEVFTINDSPTNVRILVNNHRIQHLWLESEVGQLTEPSPLERFVQTQMPTISEFLDEVELTYALRQQFADLLDFTAY